MHTRILRIASHHAPKAGAVCGSSARTDMCGGELPSLPRDSIGPELPGNAGGARIHRLGPDPPDMGVLRYSLDGVQRQKRAHASQQRQLRSGSTLLKRFIFRLSTWLGFRVDNYLHHIHVRLAPLGQRTQFRHTVNLSLIR